MALSLGDIEKQDAQLGARVRLSMGALDKASRKAGVDYNGLEAEVILILDYSASMDDEYAVPRGRGLFGRGAATGEKSQVDEAVSRALAVGATLDPDQKAQAFFFDNQITSAADIELGNYQGWLERNRPRRMGSTRLDLAVLEAIKLAAQVLGKPEIARNANLDGNWTPVQADRPVLAIIVTDGEPDNQEAARRAFQAASYCPIEFVILYVSNQRAGLDFVNELNELGGTFVDNICVVKFTGGMSSVTDEKFAEGVLSEFPGWVKAVRGKLLPVA